MDAFGKEYREKGCVKALLMSLLTQPICPRRK